MKILKELEETLHGNEKILGYSALTKTNSFYVCLMKDSKKYKVIRFSDHEPSVYYLNVKTILTKLQPPILRNEIRYYLDTPWTNFNYQSFLAIKSIEEWQKNRIELWSENAYKQTFGGRRERFYIKEEYALDHKKVYLSQEVEKVFRKLLTTGLINISRSVVSRNQTVYVPNWVMEQVLSYFVPFYQESWEMFKKRQFWLHPSRKFTFSDMNNPDLGMPEVVTVTYARRFSVQDFIPYLYAFPKKSSLLSHLVTLWKKIRKPKDNSEKEAGKVIEDFQISNQDNNRNLEMPNEDSETKAVQNNNQSKTFYKAKQSTKLQKEKAVKKRHYVETNQLLSNQSLANLQYLKETLEKEEKL